MKRVMMIFAALTLFLFSSCEFVEITDEENQGNSSLLGTVIEINGDFTSKNGYSLSYDFPKSFKVYESDVVLMYILWEQTTDKYGNVSDVWRPLPQTRMLKEGVLQYNFDYTMNDVRVFLEGTIDMTKLLPAEWQNQVFRIVVLPADFAKSHSDELNDFGRLMNSLGINSQLPL